MLVSLSIHVSDDLSPSLSIYVSLNIYIYIYNPPWKKLYRIDHLGVRFYRDEAGRPVFTIEWYLDCAHPVYIPKRDTKLEALQTQFSIL